MNPARELRPFHHFPDPDYHDNLQRLERDITELAAAREKVRVARALPDL